MTGSLHYAASYTAGTLYLEGFWWHYAVLITLCGFGEALRLRRGSASRALPAIRKAIQFVFEMTLDAVRRLWRSSYRTPTDQRIILEATFNANI
jgi:hypothetical protein